MTVSSDLHMKFAFLKLFSSDLHMKFVFYIPIPTTFFLYMKFSETVFGCKNRTI